MKGNVESRTQIIIAVVGLIGVLGAAWIGGVIGPRTSGAAPIDRLIEPDPGPLPPPRTAHVWISWTWKGQNYFKHDIQWNLGGYADTENGGSLKLSEMKLDGPFTTDGDFTLKLWELEIPGGKGIKDEVETLILALTVSGSVDQKAADAASRIYFTNTFHLADLSGSENIAIKANGLTHDILQGRMEWGISF